MAEATIQSASCYSATHSHTVTHRWHSHQEQFGILFHMQTGGPWDQTSGLKSAKNVLCHHCGHRHLLDTSQPYFQLTGNPFIRVAVSQLSSPVLLATHAKHSSQAFNQIQPSILTSLHWLPVTYRKDFMILLFTYKALYGLALSIISELLHPYITSRTLRSSNQNKTMDVLLHLDPNPLELIKDPTGGWISFFLKGAT